MNPLQVNPLGLSGVQEKKIVQRADIVWSKMKLEPGEYLLVKVADHARPILNEIHAMVDHCFKKEGDRVIVFCEGDISFEKVKFE